MVSTLAKYSLEGLPREREEETSVEHLQLGFDALETALEVE